MSDPQLQVRIYDIDWVFASPGPLDNSNMRKAPVLRIFGDSSVGIKTCVHVHQVYPYFYVEYMGKLDGTSVKQYTSRLFKSLNQALAISMRRTNEQAAPQYLRAVVLIHFVDPRVVTRAATILQSGTVMTTRFRVFESHINYPLQFMCDFALYGCGWLDMSHVQQRTAKPSALTQLSNESNTQTKLLFPLSGHFCETRTPLEVDVAAYHIMNRHRVTARNMHHELKIPGAPLPSEPLISSVRELWEDERRQRAARGLHPSPELPVDPSEASRSAGGDWINEVRYWDDIKKRIQADDGPVIPSTSADAWQRSAMTTFQSVEALWEPAWKTWTPEKTEKLPQAPPVNVSDTAGQPEDEVFKVVITSDEQGYQGQGDGLEEDQDINERILSSQAVTQLIAETEVPRWQLDEDDEGLQQLSGGEENEYSFEEDVDTASEFGTPDQQMSTQSSPETLRQDIQEEPGSPTPSRKRASKPISNSKDLPITPQLREEVRHARLPTDDANGLLDDLASGNVLSEETTMNTGGHTSSLSSSNNQIDSILLDEAENPFLTPTRVTFTEDHSRTIGTSSRKKARLAEPSTSASLIPSRSLHASSYRPSLRSRPPDLGTSTYAYTTAPPKASELVLNVEAHGLHQRLYRAPWYSDPDDAPDGPREFAGLVYHLKGGDGVETLEEWLLDTNAELATQPTYTPSSGWEFQGQPPTAREARLWIMNAQGRESEWEEKRKKWRSQIQGATMAQVSKPIPAKVGRSDLREKQNLSILAVEIFATSQGALKPDPSTDGIVGLFYAFHDADVLVDPESPMQSFKQGAVVVNDGRGGKAHLRDSRVETVMDELDILNRLMDLLRDFDPDVLAGWEVQNASWGYIRARCQSYGMDFDELVSRAPGREKQNSNTDWGYKQTSTIKVIGRHMLNLWRIMRSDQNLRIYTFENVAYHLLRERFPHYTAATLTGWYQSMIPTQVIRVLTYFRERTTAVVRMLDAAEVVTKTAEFARVFGVDFFSVLDRGSQYKVESFLLRIAKPESFVMLSPSRADVGKQNAIECMPLIMEPLSAFYGSPLVVLDFQSLYPSIMIAYNYCYSTCLGRVRKFKGTNKFGVTELDLPPGLLGKLQDHINVAPNGIMYTKPHVRQGLLGRMLRELLQTRVMVKQAMKGVKNDKARRRVLDARQLGLKFISNVTYGYTSATFSGRMPAVEIADSIVQSGRETLEKAIKLIHSTPKWGAKVVYGDTDSLFIYLVGKTKEQAFRIGYDIADAVTALNPAPIKLKFEKVYLPCMMMAKKRYVGNKFENPDDEVPIFDAKGIETVRRDGCAAQAKMTEQCLKLLFRTRDLSQVKDYCYESWFKLIDQRVTIQDFVFSKEVRLGSYSDKIPPPPGVTVAARRTANDSNDEVQYGERVAYVIVRGAPGTKLLERAYDPKEVLEDPQKRLDAKYYITRVLIPPLDRIFGLLGADVRSWYDDMPKAIRSDNVDPNTLSPKKVLIERMVANVRHIEGHFQNSQCILCGSHAPAGMCRDCYQAHQSATAALGDHISECETRLKNAHDVCRSCASSTPTEPIRCESLDCPWFYERRKAEDGMEMAAFAQSVIDSIENEGNGISEALRNLDEAIVDGTDNLAYGGDPLFDGSRTNIHDAQGDRSVGIAWQIEE